MGIFTQTETMRFTASALHAEQLREALADRFDIEALEERERHLRLTIRRMVAGRIHPQAEQPSMEIWIFPEKEALTYTLTWPKHWTVLIAMTVFGFGWIVGQRTGLFVLGLMAVIAGLTWLDHREIAKDLRRALLQTPGVEELP